MKKQMSLVMEDCKRMLLSQETSVDEVIEYLHHQEVSIIDSIVALRELYQIPLGEAKKLVAAHSAWRPLAERADELHQELIDTINSGNNV